MSCIPINILFSSRNLVDNLDFFSLSLNILIVNTYYHKLLYFIFIFRYFIINLT